MTTANGTSLATLVAMPTLSLTSATMSTFLYAGSASSAKTDALAARTTMPRFSKAGFYVATPELDVSLHDRLIILPAPCAVEPKVKSMAFSAPTSTHELVPMLPGISTGCPSLR